MVTVTPTLTGKRESEDQLPISPDITNVHIKTVQNHTGTYLINSVLKEVLINILNSNILTYLKPSTFLTL